MRPFFIACVLSATAAAWPAACRGADPEHPVLTWVKRHPNADAKVPPPRLGYECAYGYDPARRLLVRYGGHNQGGGGEQNSEVWTYDLGRDVWALREPNDAPPGVCCAQQDVFHDALGLFVRFPAFSNSHGWQSAREVSLHDSSAWTYDVGANTWTDMRPVPEPRLRPLRGAAYDPGHQVVVVHGGEGADHGTVVYDLYTNTWHDMNPPEAPPETSQPGFTYDPAHKVFVLFGSQFGDDPRTWLYDLRRNRWRVLQTDARPPFEKTSPVLAADTRSGIVLASLQGKDRPETWALDVGKATWRKLDVAYSPAEQYEGSNGSRNRVLLYLPDRNLFVMENRTRDEQQIWTFRYADAAEPAALPRDLRVAAAADGPAAVLTWAAPRADGPHSYRVYRGTGERPWEVEWQVLADGVKDTRHRDGGVKPGVNYWYKVHALNGGKEGPASTTARTQPPVVRDLTVSVLGPKQIQLNWQGLDGAGVRYHVERADVLVYSTDEVKRIKDRQAGSDIAVGHIRQIGPFRQLTDEPLAGTNFTDRDVDLTGEAPGPFQQPPLDRSLRGDQLDPEGKPYKYRVYAYRVRAVNPLGVPGGPSPARFTFPSPVQFVFAKEEGKEAARLKWASSSEKALRGYHVYRHDGRFNNSKIVRLTREPVGRTAFTDPEAGADTRRYEVVAVDALGQEGVPSQPVWSRREWASFYTPYVGEWHQ